MERIHEIMDRELPAIGAKNERIIQGPYYKGVSEINGSSLKLRFSAECEGRSLNRVTTFLNEEIIELMKREEIEIAAR